MATQKANIANLQALWAVFSKIVCKNRYSKPVMSKAEEKATKSTLVKRAGVLTVEKCLINSGRVRWPKHQRTPSYINGDASQCMYQHMFSNNASLTSERPHLLIPHDLMVIHARRSHGLMFFPSSLLPLLVTFANVNELSNISPPHTHFPICYPFLSERT